MLIDALLDAFLDSLKILPFLFVTFLFMEWLEHGAQQRFVKRVASAGKAGPLVGALLGIVPQCGFSGAAATLYAGRVITLGTLISVFLCTSDEMLPIMLSEAVSPLIIGKVLGIKFVCGLVFGFVIDAILRKTGREHTGLANKSTHAGHEGNDIHFFCESEGCECVHEDCEHCHHGHEHEHGHDHGHKVNFGHLAWSALKHSVQIIIFIFIICFLLNLVVEAGLEQTLAVVQDAPIVSTIVCAVLGFIPNCAVSVAFTQLYLEGVLGGGAMIAGLLVNAGIGLLVLLRTNNDARENVRICGVMLVIGVVIGLLVEFSGLL